MGVGMPANLKLEEFASHVRAAFGHVLFHVGSSLTQKSGWRDVDIRVILPDDEYESMGFGKPNFPSQNAAWVALCLAFSALGREMTGLPVDFQIQQMTRANEENDGPRSAIGLTMWRMATEEEE